MKDVRAVESAICRAPLKEGEELAPERQHLRPLVLRALRAEEDRLRDRFTNAKEVKIDAKVKDCCKMPTFD